MKQSKVLLHPSEPNCILQTRKHCTAILLHQITQHAASYSFRQMVHFQQALALAVSEKIITKKKLLAVAYSKHTTSYGAIYSYFHETGFHCCAEYFHCSIFIRTESRDTGFKRKQGHQS